MQAGWRVSGEAVRIAIFYFVYCCISGFYTPYWSVFLQSRAVRPEEIGLIFAAGSVIRPFVLPAWGFLADRYLGLKTTLLILTIFTAIALSLFGGAHGFLAFLGLAVVAMTFWAPMLPLTDAMALGHQALGRLTYGRVRLWGSIAYILMTLVGGSVLAHFGPTGIWASMVICAVLLIPIAVIQHAPKLPHGEGGRPTVADLVRVLTRTRLGLVLVAGGLLDSTHSLYYGFATIHWRSIGIPDSAIGYLWSIGVVAEVILLAVAGRWLKKSSGLPFMAIAGVGSVIRWSLLSLDPHLPALYAVQLIHAVTYSANLLGIMTYIQRNAPHRFAGSIQSVYAALSSGVFASSAMAVSGRLYASFGAEAYLAMSAIALLGLGVLAFAWRCEPAPALPPDAVPAPAVGPQPQP